MFSQRPAYRLECRNERCSWEGTYYFYHPTPDICPRCNTQSPKRQSLQTGPGYDHQRDYKRAA
jgi:hypothetical protein